MQQVQTPYGPVTVKVATLEGRRMNFVAEYEDCRRLATALGVPLKEIQNAAAQAYRESVGSEPEGTA